MKSALVGLALLLGGWTWNSVTWSGGNQLVLSDGGICLQLCSDGGLYELDGGRIYVDSGIVLFDAGVCADGGTGIDCTACSGTCLADSGIQVYDSGVVIAYDGGFECGGGVTLTSDLFPATSVADITCYVPQCVGACNYENANVTMSLVGSSDKELGVPQTYQNTSQTCQALDGGACSVSWAQGQPGLFPRTAVQITANPTDGGDLFMCCPYSVQ
jgi:hypothetical protein